MLWGCFIVSFPMDLAYADGLNGCDEAKIGGRSRKVNSKCAEPNAPCVKFASIQFAKREMQAGYGA
ncbi:MAG: hypothetical protein AAGA22_09560, partial [Pseudomonadota bacterium]